MEATPRPWSVNSGIFVDGADGITVFGGASTHRSEDECEANAELTVRAVNSFDALVDALEDATAWLRGVLPVGSVLTPEFRRMEAALAAAKVGATS